MSTVAPSVPLPARVPSPARHALRMPLSVTVTMGAWFWGVVLVGATVGTVVAARVAGSVDVCGDRLRPARAPSGSRSP